MAFCEKRKNLPELKAALGKNDRTMNLFTHSHEITEETVQRQRANGGFSSGFLKIAENACQSQG
jgi:hypothetical protein